MTGKAGYRSLGGDEITALERQGCTSPDWSRVTVADGFDSSLVRNASLINCAIGNRVRIANVGGHIANYEIGDDALIENVGTLQTNAGAAFGNGVEIDVLNEAGGREVVLFDTISSQFAYMMCLHRYRPRLIERLQEMARDYAAAVVSDTGTIGRGACIRSTAKIIDVNIGPYAKVDGASSLINGTILSSQEAPSKVGNRVIAKDFIVAEDAVVDGGAILSGVYVGQSCRIGRQYSAENSVFFANSEAFNGEACSVFGGPYTVTHHKSSLLIAGLFSFYNAGSGTNQSNHMYKLGPVHEGKVERGSKTGSFSYMMWPCRVGPFSVVLGKHTSTFDTSCFPFSHLEARPDGKCAMVPGLYLTTVGTVRDGAKWPKRDRRKGEDKRDIISFDVFSPYTVGRMIKAGERLKKLSENTDKSIEEVSVGGAMVRRPILRTGCKYYRIGIEMYLLGKLVERLAGSSTLSEALSAADGAVHSEEWVDIGGQMMPRQRLSDLEDAVEDGSISTVDDFAKASAKIHESYRDDEWLWVKNAYQRYFGNDLDGMSAADISQAARDYGRVRTKFLNLVIADAEKEFAEMSRCGFGQDGAGEDDAQNDFNNVRGLYEDNKFVKEMRDCVAETEGTVEAIIKKIEAW